MAESEEQRKARHGSMSGIKITLPDGRVLEVDSEGRPVDFRKPEDLAKATP